MSVEKNNKKLIVILGPTATGKTKFAVDLAQKFNGEIISADSRQVYKNLNIGTGKDLKEYKKIKYNLINIVNPDKNFTVAKYKKLALKKINNIIKKNKIPFLVGGTGLYISSIVDNYDIPKIASIKIKNKINKLSNISKINLLKKLDPACLKFVAVDNPRRLDRALEVCMSGQKFSATRKKGKPLFDILQIGLILQREKLNRKIDSRVDQMIKSGLVNETKKIIKEFGTNSIPLQTIGYAEIMNFLQKKTDLPETVKLVKLHTHQFAKRQMTWFKRDKNIHWIKNKADAEKMIKKFLK
ncbi:MAG: tRNA (adenosine(37)-N6)-dimethylallyltransferase MiaA [Patescibacteria group bacterium]